MISNLRQVWNSLNRFHRGHEQLLLAAYNTGNRVMIGITSDQYARSHKNTLTSIIIYTYPIISTLMAIIFLGEHYNKYIFLGIGTGFAGLLVIFSNSLLVGFRPGIIIALLGAITWASGTIYFMKYHTKKDRETTNFFQFGFAPLLIYQFPPGMISNLRQVWNSLNQ